MITEAPLEICTVQGVRMIELRHIEDSVRGDLTVSEISRDLPFQPQRWFMTYRVPSRQTRGEHAHIECSQFLVCAHGECRLRVDDGENCHDFHLNRPTFGILVPPMVWASEYEHSSDSVLLVLTSHDYDPDDYIRDYDQFLEMIRVQSTLL